MLHIGGSMSNWLWQDVSGACPQWSRFFHFDIQHFQNVTTSGVKTPPLRSKLPLSGNPGSTTTTFPIVPYLEDI